MPAKPKNSTPHRLADKSVEQLRALAKSRGLKNYSRLAKEKLLKLLAAAPRPKVPKKSVARGAPGIAKKAKKKKAVRRAAPRSAVEKSAASAVRKTAPPPAAPRKPQAGRGKLPRANKPPAGVTKSAPPALEAEKTSPVYTPPPTLPEITGPMLTLRPQKPGVVHAAWAVDPAKTLPLAFLRLRIQQIHAGNTRTVEDISLPEVRGRLYFQVAPEFWGGTLRGELGYHSSDGRFIVMHQHEMTSLPRGQASGRSDALWWISEADFRALYARSGGLVTDAVLAWGASFSSR